MLWRCARYKHWIENTGLMDLGYSGPKFTWSRGRDWSTMKQARLDRALYNMAWRLNFPEGAVGHLLQAQSDHASLLITLRGFSHLAQSRKPFRFQVAWTTHSNFNTVLRATWNCHNHLVVNLSNLVIELNHWKKKVFGNLFRRKRRLWAIIAGIQRSLADGGP